MLAARTLIPSVGWRGQEERLRAGEEKLIERWSTSHNYSSSLVEP